MSLVFLRHLIRGAEVGTQTFTRYREAVSALKTSDAAAQFDLQLAMLDEVASTDNVTRALKNVYANTSADGKSYYRVEPFFIYRAAIDQAKNQFSPPGSIKVAPLGGDATEFKYGFYFQVNDPATATFDQICSKAKILTLVPPSDLTKNATTYNAQNPLSTAPITQSGGGSQVQCAGGEFFMQGSAGQQNYGFNFGGGGYDGAILPGLWRLRIDGTEVAAYDLAAYSPVRADGKPLVYVPSLKVSVNAADNKIEGIELKFFYWDATGAAFREVTDLSVLSRSIEKLGISITDNDGINGGCSGQRISEDKNLTTSVGNVFSYPAFTEGRWRYAGDASTTEKVANDISVRYTIAGMVLHFTFLPPGNGC